MNSSIESAGLPNKGHKVAQIDRNGVITVGVFVRGDYDCVMSFSVQPGNKLGRAHDDKRVINESVNGTLRKLPVAPGSVVITTPDGKLVDYHRDGRLYPLGAAGHGVAGPAVATVNYFTGELRWLRDAPEKTTSDVDPDSLSEDELEAYLMGELQKTILKDVKASYLQTEIIKAHTKKVRSVSVGARSLLCVYVAANGGGSRVRIDL